MNISNNAIALIGTSADPPTCGHEALFRGLSTLFPKVITWASDNPIKSHSTPLEIRHQLLKALVKNISVPELEIVQELSSPWTINTIKKANDHWPKADLVFVIGSDLVSQIPTWLEVKNLLKQAKIAIAIREGWPVDENQLKQLEALGGKIDLLPLRIPKFSSSTFRQKYNISEIPQAILPLLEKQNLYGVFNKNQ